MMKKGILFFVLIIFAFAISGCATLQGAAEGAKKDWQVLMKADNWIKNNLW